MANPKRVQALLALAEEDSGAVRILLGFSMRIARYHVQQSAEKAVKALLEHRGINPGREHRFEVLAEMLPEGDRWRFRRVLMSFHQLRRRTATPLRRGEFSHHLHGSSSKVRSPRWRSLSST